MATNDGVDTLLVYFPDLGVTEAARVWVASDGDINRALNYILGDTLPHRARTVATTVVAAEPSIIQIQTPNADVGTLVDVETLNSSEPIVPASVEHVDVSLATPIVTDDENEIEEHSTKPNVAVDSLAIHSSSQEETIKVCDAESESLVKPAAVVSPLSEAVDQPTSVDDSEPNPPKSPQIPWRTRKPKLHLFAVTTTSQSDQVHQKATSALIACQPQHPVASLKQIRLSAERIGATLPLHQKKPTSQIKDDLLADDCGSDVAACPVSSSVEEDADDRAIREILENQRRRQEYVVKSKAAPVPKILSIVRPPKSAAAIIPTLPAMSFKSRNGGKKQLNTQNPKVDAKSVTPSVHSALPDDEEDQDQDSQEDCDHDGGEVDDPVQRAATPVPITHIRRTKTCAPGLNGVTFTSDVVALRRSEWKIGSKVWMQMRNEFHGVQGFVPFLALGFIQDRHDNRWFVELAPAAKSEPHRLMRDEARLFRISVDDTQRLWFPSDSLIRRYPDELLIDPDCPPRELRYNKTTDKRMVAKEAIGARERFYRALYDKAKRAGRTWCRDKSMNKNKDVLPDQYRLQNQAGRLWVKKDKLAKIKGSDGPSPSRPSAGSDGVVRFEDGTPDYFALTPADEMKCFRTMCDEYWQNMLVVVSFPEDRKLLATVRAVNFNGLVLDVWELPAACEVCVHWIEIPLRVTIVSDRLPPTSELFAFDVFHLPPDAEARAAFLVKSDVLDLFVPPPPSITDPPPPPPPALSAQTDLTQKLKNKKSKLSDDEPEPGASSDLNSTDEDAESDNDNTIDMKTSTPEDSAQKTSSSTLLSDSSEDDAVAMFLHNAAALQPDSIVKDLVIRVSTLHTLVPTHSTSGDEIVRISHRVFRGLHPWVKDNNPYASATCQASSELLHSQLLHCYPSSASSGSTMSFRVQELQPSSVPNISPPEVDDWDDLPEGWQALLHRFLLPFRQAWIAHERKRHNVHPQYEQLMLKEWMKEQREKLNKKKKSSTKSTKNSKTKAQTKAISKKSKQKKHSIVLSGDDDMSDVDDDDTLSDSDASEPGARRKLLPSYSSDEDPGDLNQNPSYRSEYVMLYERDPKGKMYLNATDRAQIARHRLEPVLVDDELDEMCPMCFQYDAHSCKDTDLFHAEFPMHKKLCPVTFLFPVKHYLISYAVTFEEVRLQRFPCDVLATMFPVLRPAFDRLVRRIPDSIPSSMPPQDLYRYSAEKWHTCAWIPATVPIQTEEDEKDEESKEDIEAHDVDASFVMEEWVQDELRKDDVVMRMLLATDAVRDAAVAPKSLKRSRLASSSSSSSSSSSLLTSTLPKVVTDKVDPKTATSATPSDSVVYLSADHAKDHPFLQAFNRSVQRCGMKPTVDLRDYQIQSTLWMLQQESVHGDTQLTPLFQPFVVHVRDHHPATGTFAFWYSIWTHKATLTPPPVIMGGFLADEMGTGKTVEVLAGIVLDKELGDRPVSLTSDKFGYKYVNTTLIVATPTLSRQWISEVKDKTNLTILDLHSTNRKRVLDAESIAQYDIAIVTPATLRKMHSDAESERDRIMRQCPWQYDSLYPTKYASPLHRLHWRRLVLDESDAVKNGASKFAASIRSVVCQRRWNISGTPLGMAIRDCQLQTRTLGLDRTVFGSEFWRQVERIVMKVSSTGRKLSQYQLNQIRNKQKRGAGPRVRSYKSSDDEDDDDFCSESESDDDVAASASTERTLRNMILLLVENSLMRHEKLLPYANRPRLLELPPRSEFVRLIPLSTRQQMVYNMLFDDARQLYRHHVRHGTVKTNKLAIRLSLRPVEEFCAYAVESNFDSRWKTYQARLTRRAEEADAAASATTAPVAPIADSKGYTFVPAAAAKAMKEVSSFPKADRPTLGSLPTSDCCLCLDMPMQTPVQLCTCQHAFCLECISNVFHSLGGGTAPCPVCRSEFRLSDFRAPYEDPAVILSSSSSTTSTDVMNSTGSADVIDLISDDDDDATTTANKHSKSSKSSLDTVVVPTHLTDSAELPEVCDDEPDTVVMDAKLNELVNDILRMREEAPADKVLIFTRFGLSMSRIRTALASVGIRVLHIDGQTTLPKRSAVMDQFRTDADAFVMVLSMRAVSAAGLTLTAACHVKLFDAVPNSALAAQAMARVHRIGQRRAVTCEFWTAKGTIEETVNTICRERLALTRRREETAEGAPTTESGLSASSVSSVSSAIAAVGTSATLPSFRSTMASSAPIYDVIDSDEDKDATDLLELKRIFDTPCFDIPSIATSSSSSVDIV